MKISTTTWHAKLSDHFAIRPPRPDKKLDTTILHAQWGCDSPRDNQWATAATSDETTGKAAQNKSLELYNPYLN